MALGEPGMAQDEAEDTPVSGMSATPSDPNDLRRRACWIG